MGSEVLLYLYGAVSLSMIVFNIIYNLILNEKDRRLTSVENRFVKKMEEQLERLDRGEAAEEKHFQKLVKKLSRVGNLNAFDKMLRDHLEPRASEPAVQKYMHELQNVFLQLAVVYRDRENVQAAYFAYFLAGHRQKNHMAVDTIQDIMVDYMKKDNLYCRVNALQALYEFGSPESVVEAVALQDRMGRFFHEKILTDGLLSFKGDHRRLTRLLWERLDRFSDRTKLSVLNYIRFRSGEYQEEMYAIMTDEEADKELRLSAVRYVGRYPYPPAKQALLSFAADRDPNRWEYLAVSVSALAAYPGEDVISALMGAIHSSNWYVRSNAAESLRAHGLGYEELLEVVGGQDRYAREMMMYRLDRKRLEEEDAMERAVAE